MMAQVANLTKTVDGVPLPKEKFAYVGDPEKIETWHLPIDAKHLQAAVDLFGHEKHVPANMRVQVARRIAMAAKAHGIDVSNFEKKYCGAGEHSESPDYSNGWIEIFRAGDYTKMGKRKITVPELQRIADGYDPSYHEAPVVVGHPTMDGPAYAWISELRVDGDTLLAKEKQVDPAFAELRNSGRFKKRSAAFYQDADGNPIGLRHVGWLGAQPPVVKGLREASFGDSTHNFEEYEFEEESMAGENEKSVPEQIKAFFAEMFGGKPGTQGATFSESEVKRVASEAVAAATAPLTNKIAKLESDLATQKSQFSEQQKSLAGSEARQRVDAAISRLKAAGSWVPAFDRMGLPAFFAELSRDNATAEYGEGDQKKTETALDFAVRFMEGLGKIVPSGTIYGGARSQGASTTSKDDPLTAATREYMKTNKDVTFGEAMIRVAAEHPELERVNQSAGQV